MEKKTSINLSQLNRLLESADGATVIDVRSEEEYKEQHIPFALSLPLEKLETKTTGFDHGKLIITVCGKGGGRSERAAELIRKNYNAEAYFLEEGTFGWFKMKEEC